MDIIYLDRKPILYAINAATAFQTSRFLNNMSAKETWEALCQCWIDTSFGAPAIITHDVGTNYDSIEFYIEAKILDITCYQIFIEVHWSIGKVEKYHILIHCVYDNIEAETQGIISKNAMLQIAFKAMNDTARPNSLVSTFFVFGSYSHIVMDLPPSSSQEQQTNTIVKTISELCKLKT